MLSSQSWFSQDHLYLIKWSVFSSTFDMIMIVHIWYNGCFGRPPGPLTSLIPWSLAMTTLRVVCIRYNDLHSSSLPIMTTTSCNIALHSMLKPSRIVCIDTTAFGSLNSTTTCHIQVDFGLIELPFDFCSHFLQLPWPQHLDYAQTPLIMAQMSLVFDTGIFRLVIGPLDLVAPDPLMSTLFALTTTQTSLVFNTGMVSGFIECLGLLAPGPLPLTWVPSTLTPFTLTSTSFTSTSTPFTLALTPLTTTALHALIIGLLGP